MSDPSQTPQQETVHSQLQCENKTEHVLHIALTGGDVVSIPPVENGRHTLKFTDADERARFEQALQTQEVQSWIREGHLVIHGGSAPSSADAVPPPTPTTPSTPSSKRTRTE